MVPTCPFPGDCARQRRRATPRQPQRSAAPPACRSSRAHLGGELLAGRLATGGLAGRLLRAGHGCCFSGYLGLEGGVCVSCERWNRMQRRLVINERGRAPASCCFRAGKLPGSWLSALQQHEGSRKLGLAAAPSCAFKGSASIQSHQASTRPPKSPPTSTTARNSKQPCPDAARAARASARAAPSATARSSATTSRASPSPPSAAWPAGALRSASVAAVVGPARAPWCRPLDACGGGSCSLDSK